MNSLRRFAACSVTIVVPMSMGACEDPAEGPRTIAFEADFFTDLVSMAPDPSCPAPRLLNVQDGSGQASELGSVTVHISFCVDPTDLLNDGQLSAGESLPYDNGVGTLVAANGDELHIEVSGAVVPSSDPNFDFEFSDPFTIVGGTGQFAGASGSGTTSSFVDFGIQPSRTTHEWTGTLTIQPGS